MELFCKKAFRFDYDGCCPDHLMNISSETVKKCEGLPLAIVAIGGLLYGKEKTTFEWQKIRQSLCSEMEKNPHLIGIRMILGFSYDDLPYYLKSCLLYFGISPEDYEVKSTRLIRQWIAEGFVKDEEGKTLEEVAQQYLTELIGRSLVQVSSFTVDGKAKSYHVHDLLRDMILRKFKDLSFCHHICKEDESMSSDMFRRLSIVNNSTDLMGSTESSHTWSLPIISTLPMLRKLRLNGKLNKFAEWTPQLQNLVKLSLILSQLTDDPLKSLQNMPHLLFLYIGPYAYKGESLYFQGGGFRRLKELYLKYLSNLNSIIIDEGALHSLERLHFWGIPQLNTVPTGIQHLEKLDVLDAYYMSYEFQQCIAQLPMEDQSTHASSSCHL